MRGKLLAIVLTITILVASAAGFACRPQGVHAATAEWIANESAVRLESPSGESTTVKGLASEEFEALSAAGEATIELVAQPAPGDIVTIVMKRECAAEELIILSQYVEVRDYVSDVYKLPKAILDALAEILSRYFLLPIPPPSSFLPSKGIAYGILKAGADKVETLPFVDSMKGCRASKEALEILKMPFGLAHEVQAQEKEVMSVGASEFQVLALAEIQQNVQVLCVGDTPSVVTSQGTTYQVEQVVTEDQVAQERQFVVRTESGQLMKLYYVEGEMTWSLSELH
ncbi:MAG: hypothetical protein NTU41_08550 [Chloroflexi bacterium]|nr:hypothetical protein [Chloroflexota bacterium]